MLGCLDKFICELARKFLLGMSDMFDGKILMQHSASNCRPFVAAQPPKSHTQVPTKSDLGGCRPAVTV